MRSRLTVEMHTDPESLLVLAKAGYGPALARLLNRYQEPLAEQARGQVGRRLLVKLDVEDLLQEVSLEAHRNIGRFRGCTEAEFLSWLRNILDRIVLNLVRHYYGTRRRDLRHERRITADGDASSRNLECSLVAPHTSPTQQAARHERESRLADAIRTLPTRYREVIVLRHIEGLSFREVARRLGRTEHSVKNMWVRALNRLRALLGDLQ